MAGVVRDARREGLECVHVIHDVPITQGVKP